MLADHDFIEGLAERIERAYRLRGRNGSSRCSTTIVWAAAAWTLSRACRSETELPIDPELFVASQPFVAWVFDPWKDLTRPLSIRRYRLRVQKIVRGLREELRLEIRRAERLVRGGSSLEAVLLEASRSLSPLGRYIAARRARRPDLAARLLRSATDQHRSCPLYRQASSDLLPPEFYPVKTSAYDDLTSTLIASHADFALRN